jgi:putative membrane protein
MMHWGYEWWFDLGWVYMIIIWVLVLLGFIFVIRMVFGGTKKEEHEETALDILKKRYAKGEISKEEFEEKKFNVNS